jgi:hypothetical protein
MNKDEILILLIDRKKGDICSVLHFSKILFNNSEDKICKNIRYKINHKVYKTDKQEGTKTKRKVQA